MIRTIKPANFTAEALTCPVIDVRSPGEYLQGHIPGAANIPLFSDAERAIVGTLYVKSGREDAILKGLDIALPKVGQFRDALLALAPLGDLMVHCWRGGLRSALMAKVFGKAGYDVRVIEGGYKAWRRFVRESLAEKAKIVVLGGYTGIGKTEILKAIARAGEQVIDLELLACHKGSVFGALGQPPQPTNEQFENDLWQVWHGMDLRRPVWLEDESRMIGKVTLPDPVIEHLSQGVLIRASLDHEKRIERLVNEYAGFDPDLLADAILKIRERLGGARTTEALEALNHGRFADVAGITLAYYDKAYHHSLSGRKNQIIAEIPITGTDPDEDAHRIISFFRDQKENGTDLF